MAGSCQERCIYMYIEETESYAEEVVKNVLRGSKNLPVTMKFALHAMIYVRNSSPRHEGSYTEIVLKNLLNGFKKPQVP